MEIARSVVALTDPEPLPPWPVSIDPSAEGNLESSGTRDLINPVGRRSKQKGGIWDASGPRQRRRDFRECASPIQTEMREVGNPFRIEEAPTLRKAQHQTETQSDCRTQESASQAR